MDFNIRKILRRKQYQTGLVLSGGGARGVSHLGAIKALKEKGYTIDIISGTSIGAIAGCLICDGYEPDEILKMLTPSTVKTFIKTDFSLQNFLKLEGVRDFLHDVLHTEYIEDLPTPFIAVATNLIKGEVTYFKKGKIVDSVIASASIPIVFPPTVIDGERYVDGGVLSNLPVKPIRSLCETVIGLHVNPANMGLHEDDVKSLLQIAERSFYLAIRGNLLEDKNQCDIFIEHEDLYSYKVLGFDRIKEIFDIGYQNTISVLDKLKIKN